MLQHAANTLMIVCAAVFVGAILRATFHKWAQRGSYRGLFVWTFAGAVAMSLLILVGALRQNLVEEKHASATAAKLEPQLLAGTVCPDLKSGNPIAAAKAASSRGDCHLLMMGGLAGTIPGGEGSLRSYRFVAGTGDDGDKTGMRERCDVPWRVANRWAEQYNQTIVELDLTPAGCGAP